MPEEILEIENQKVTLNNIPEKESLFVFSKGIFQTEGRDYKIEGKVITFFPPLHSKNPTPDGAEITVRYKSEKEFIMPPQYWPEQYLPYPETLYQPMTEQELDKDLDKTLSPDYPKPPQPKQKQKSFFLKLFGI